MKYAIYKNEQIMRVVTCPVDMIKAQITTDEKYCKCANDVNDDTHLVREKKVIKKKEQLVLQDKTSIIANGVDTVTFSNIPKGATVSISAAGTFVETIVDDGTVEITLDTVGEYIITIKSFPYLDYVGVINGTN